MFRRKTVQTINHDERQNFLDPEQVLGLDHPSRTFRVLQNNEMKRRGEYRTRHLVLAAYDQVRKQSMRPRGEGYR